ncbi:ubiquinol-cytochrome C chaperone family protein [Asticcacaulis sp. BYS171W]|uniref:Ubiquinol-cytochrome C chaperone family protein n=1 Tax=Asticcacaulis aquaticus TaxID=2984212 RepID=A0ABT5HPA2_9CAUL|nr:ubiquinol-cytochrome C chaperone family protein [Asticcacaulis aquaticus]MDC7681886.1 ubiquinol-cytochrome C chaperone family protein [Asticcacaulis aquaticus]
MLEKILKSLGLQKARPTEKAGEALYAAAVAQSRQVVFYTDYGVKDEIGARFELLVLHVVMLVDALKSDEPQRKETSQALFDALLLALDDTLREQGIGDLTVPKKMKKLAQQVYTRLVRWDEIWSEGGDDATQTDYILKTVYAQDESEAVEANAPLWAAGLSAYITEVRQGVDVNELLAGRVNWPHITEIKVEG